MKFTSHVDTNFTAYRGEVTTTFNELCSIFGPPFRGPNDAQNDKVSCEWRLKFADGTIATIYDWKIGYTPMAPYEWHIGGHTNDAVDLVMEHINQHRDPFIKMMREYKQDQV